MKALDSGCSCRDVALKFGVWKMANFQDQDFTAKFMMYVHTFFLLNLNVLSMFNNIQMRCAPLKLGPWDEGTPIM